MLLSAFFSIFEFIYLNKIKPFINIVILQKNTTEVSSMQFIKIE